MKDQNTAISSIKEYTKAITEINTRTKEWHDLNKMLDKRTKAMEKASMVKFSPGALEELGKYFHSNQVTLIKQLEEYRTMFIHTLNDKDNTILFDISIRDSRVAMRSSDYWLSRILNLVLIVAVVCIAVIDLTKGISPHMLWIILFSAFGVYVIPIVFAFILR